MSFVAGVDGYVSGADAITRQVVCCIKPISVNLQILQVVRNIQYFTPVTELKIKTFIMSSPTKSCNLDLISISCLDTLIVPIAQIINHSIKSDTVPPELEESN